MTISSATNTAGPFAGNGSTTAFPFAFKVFSRSELLIQVTDVAGVVSTLVLDSDYSVSLNADQDASPGGTITYPISGAALAVGETLIVSTDLPYTQLTDITNAGGFLPQVIEDALDRNVRLMQQLGVMGEQALRVPIGETAAVLPSAGLRAGTTLHFDSEGNPYVAPPGIDSAVELASDLSSGSIGRGSSMVAYMGELSGSERQSVESALRRRRVNIFDCLTLAEQLDVLARGHNYDLGTKIQALSNALYLRGGGIIEFPVGHYAHSAELWIKQGVIWEGEMSCFREPYSDPYPAPEGSVLWKLAGSHNNGVLIKSDLTLTGGVLYDTGFGTSKRNNGARHGGGIRNMTVWGNRSANPAFTAKDRNNVGSGIVAIAARNIVIEGCCSMMWADDSFSFGIHDYGTGLIGVNVARVSKNTAMSASRDGFGGTIGDSRITDNTFGFCGRHGLCMYLGNTIVALCTAWNCGGGGFYLSGIAASNTGSALIGCLAYDNDSYGFKIDGAGGGKSVPLQSCTARGNGRNSLGAYTTNQEKSNFWVSSSAEKWALLSCVSSATDQDGAVTAAYGFCIENWTNPGRFEACHDDELALVLPTYVAAAGNLNRPLVGETAEVYIDAEDVRTSITANNLDVGSITNIVINSATPVTINTITYSGRGRPKISIRNIGAGSTTLTHNTANIRINSGANLTIGANQCYVLKSVNSANTVWQQES